MRSDAELIMAAARDPQAFRELYDRWATTLAAYFYRRVHSHDVTADLLAETFAVAFESADRFRDEGRPGGAWLYGIARIELSQYFRRQQTELRAIRRLGVEIPAVDDESAAAIEQLVVTNGYRAQLAEALGRIPESERDAVELRIVAELDYAEIAARLQCTEGAARVRVHRGLARLTQLMEASS